MLGSQSVLNLLQLIIITSSLELSLAFQTPCPIRFPSAEQSLFRVQYCEYVLKNTNLAVGTVATCLPSKRGMVALNQFVKGIVDEEDDKLNKDDIPPFKSEVSMESLHGLDIRAATISFAETVPDPEHDNKPSRKYLKLKLQMGLETRTIISAIRAIYDVEEAVGKKVLVVANVPKETIMGIESHGKLLTASNPTKEPIPRTLRTVMLKPGNLPSGSTISAV